MGRVECSIILLELRRIQLTFSMLLEYQVITEDEVLEIMKHNDWTFKHCENTKRSTLLGLKIPAKKSCKTL